MNALRIFPGAGTVTDTVAGAGADDVVLEDDVIMPSSGNGATLPRMAEVLSLPTPLERSLLRRGFKASRAISGT